MQARRLLNAAFVAIAKRSLLVWLVFRWCGVIAAPPAVPVVLRTGPPIPNPGVSWIWPPYFNGSAKLEMSSDLVNWQTVVIVTNPFPNEPAPATAVGVVTTNSFFRLSL